MSRKGGNLYGRNLARRCRTALCRADLGERACFLGRAGRACKRGARLEKSTTYTVLRRLCEKGLFENDGGTVRALLSREDYLARESRSFVEQSFGGSLPAFLAAFTRGKTLTREQQDTLQALIDEARRAL